MTETIHPAQRFGNTLDDIDAPRLLALGGALALLTSFLVVLYDVVETVGDPLLFYPVVLIPLAAATVLSRLIGVTAALVVGGLVFVVGIRWHTLTLDAEFDLWVLVSNNVQLLTGETVLRIQQADVWAMMVAPTPVFLTWFLALRRRYVGATVVGSGMLGYLVLTGDAGTTVTLVGVVAAGTVLAFGQLESTGWSTAADRAVLILAVMVITPLVFTVVPGGAATPVSFVDTDETGTMEDNVVGTGDSLDIVGGVEQSPEPRFTVTAEEPQLWRTGSYDRYTGDGWVQTSNPSPLAETGFDEPSGETTELTQTFEIRTSMSQFPAAWQPVGVDDAIADDALVGPDNGLEIDGTLAEGQTVEVTSAVADPDSDELAEAGRAYPESVVERYTQLPDSTPDRVGERTEQITQNADNPFEKAVVIQQWLEANRGYSIDIDRPEGDIADAFLFEMDAGYCTYFATTMVTMLRAEEIPARMAVGYSSGEQVGEDEWLVRGLNSHAWVEVYFPDVGWVEFDPTPSAPRQETEMLALGDSAGGAGGLGGDVEDADLPRDPAAGVTDTADIEDVDDSEVPDLDDPEDPALGDALDEDGFINPDLLPDDQVPDGTGADTETDTDDEGGFALPAGRQLLVLLVAFVGMAAWVRQAGAGERLSRLVAVRFQRRSDPETDVERACERLMLVLEDRHRSRETGETMRQYLRDIHAGEDARRLVALRERARYGEEVTEADADEAIELVDRVRKSG